MLVSISRAWAMTRRPRVMPAACRPEASSVRQNPAHRDHQMRHHRLAGLVERGRKMGAGLEHGAGLLIEDARAAGRGDAAAGHVAIDGDLRDRDCPPLEMIDDRRARKIPAAEEAGGIVFWL